MLRIQNFAIYHILKRERERKRETLIAIDSNER